MKQYESTTFTSYIRSLHGPPLYYFKALFEFATEKSPFFYVKC